MNRITQIILGGLLMAASFYVAAEPGHWFDAQNPGHGVQINQDSGFGHAFTWYLYRPNGTAAFLAADENCAEFPCVLALYEPTASYMGGDLVLGPPVGSVELTPTAGGLRLDYDLRAWDWERCAGVSPGGAILNQCVGTINLTRLAL